MSNGLPTNGSSLTSAGVALVTSSDGDIAIDDAGGLYYRDRRVIDEMTFTIDGESPRQLKGSRIGPGAERLTYGHWTDRPDPPAVVVRERTVLHGYEESIAVTSFSEAIDLTFRLVLRAGSVTVYGAADISHDQAHRNLIDALWADGLTIADAGDHVILSCSTHLHPRGSSSFRWGVRLHDNEIPSTEAPSISMPDHSSQTVLDRALWDLDALTITDPKTERPFPAAGAPHFLAVFGRDALTISLFTMLSGTRRALDTLDVLAAHQGTVTDAETLEEPGRILHELRIGEMGVFGLEPGVAYYGSVDATPLFVVLLAEAMRWGASPARIRQLLPNARAAVEWCRNHVDPLGFVQSRPHNSGISNQGWKDSGDAIVDPDGRIVDDATSLVEVQGLVHQALLDLAELEATFGDADSAPYLRQEADAFRAKFHRHFSAPAGIGFALALDGSGVAINVRASNVGHLLATDIIDADAAATVADRLMTPSEFSGWGIRTLSAAEPGFHPLGYHLGTVWPHDTAVIMRGMGRQGFDAHTRRLAHALLELADANSYQFPELLGGFDRAEFPDPVPYPASARPQGWAAAVPMQIVTTLLGLRPEIHAERLTYGSMLADHERLCIRGLQLGVRTLHIEAEGRKVIITGDVNGLTLVDRLAGASGTAGKER